MSKFKVEQYETHVSTYIVEANSEAEAVFKCLNADDSTHVRTKYLEINEDLGMPVDSNQEIADSLDAMGIPIGNVIIPSIRSVSPF